jgi:hypothetical protein
MVEKTAVPAKKAPTKYYCGVAFELAGKEVRLDPSTAIGDIKFKGLECSLPSRVPLGQVDQIFDEVTGALGVDYKYVTIKEQLKDVPVLSSVVDLLGQADLAIEQFHLKKAPTHKLPDPTKSEDPATNKAVALTDAEKEKLSDDLTVAMSMTWDTASGEGKLFGNISLKGIYFKVVQGKG